MKSPMNSVWFGLLLASVLCAAVTGRMDAVTKASFDAAKGAVELAIGLIGPMALWLGLMKIAEQGGLLQALARALKPVMVRLFPRVPAEHPAMSAMILNLSANTLGLGNAATPFGVKAMVELEKINSRPGIATDAMCLFLAINTSNVTLLPLGVMAVRAAAGASEPASIVFPTIFATTVSTTVAILAAKFLSRRSQEPLPRIEPIEDSEGEGEPAKEAARLSPPHPILGWALAAGLVFLMGAGAYHVFSAPDLKEAARQILSFWLVPILMLGLASYGFFKGVPVYEAACEGAKEGFNVAVRIMPYLVLILVVVGMFRASGGFEAAARFLEPATSLLGFPAEVLPVAILRPLSGSGAFALMSEIVSRAPDSFASYLASTIQGSTETTFYVLAVYFGAAGVKDPRYAIWAALAADFAGVAAALFICHLTW